MNSPKGWSFAESALAITFVPSESFQRFVDDTKVYGCKWQCLLYFLIPEAYVYVYLCRTFLFIYVLYTTEPSTATSSSLQPLMSLV